MQLSAHDSFYSIADLCSVVNTFFAIYFAGFFRKNALYYSYTFRYRQMYLFDYIFIMKGMYHQMIRDIACFDASLCNGCGFCTNDCAYRAIVVSGSKARLVRDEFCSGCGNCVTTCPLKAVSIQQLYTLPFDPEAAQQHLADQSADTSPSFQNWPIQLKLASTSSPYFHNCELVVAASCTAFAHGNFRSYTAGHPLLVACTKLERMDYASRLSKILSSNDIRSIHAIRMDVPCCGSFIVMVRKAIELSGKDIPLKVTVVSTQGNINQ